ncbi:MAG TPA: nitroreductase family deazaflavin-dependent oxidoreductase [Nitriliruptorales bacterium]|nr:nitroreductase family deazaflavin-dependent oxidoreductase [Nitriliruptorales bacterium]
MWTVIIQVVVGVAVVGGLLALGLAAAFRTRFRPVQDRIRRLNRAATNPRVLATAGQPGASASVVHHVGRTSGTAYRTPVAAMPIEDGFVIALPYGPNADWVKNVLASGSATIEHEGETVQVERREIVSRRDANGLFPAKDQLVHSIFGVDDFLLLRRAGGASTR